MKSWLVHYSNKYPGGRVSVSENAIDVYSKDGAHCVHLEKSGAGQWVDRSEEYGCRDRHDLSPIPKNARFLKLHGDGRVGPAEEQAERKPVAEELAAKYAGKVPSLEELEKAGEKLSDAPKSERHAREWLK